MTPTTPLPSLNAPTNDRPTVDALAYSFAAILFVAIIVCNHGFDRIRASGQIIEWAGDNWQFYYFVFQNSGDLAFVCLSTLLIWFVPNRALVFVMAILLALANWGENELVSWAFFGEFLTTIDKWQWEAIDSCISIIVAIVAMPVLRRFGQSEQQCIRSLSIADIMLLTLASAVLITAVENLANLVFGNPPIAFVGWDPTIQHVISSVLFSIVGMTVVYASFCGRLISGIIAYLLAWFCAIVLTSFSLTGIENGPLKWKKQGLTMNQIIAGEYNHYLATICLFLFCILAIRWMRRLTRVRSLHRNPASD